MKRTTVLALGAGSASLAFLSAGCANRATMAAVPIPLGGNISGKIATINAPEQRLDVRTATGATYHINAQHASVLSNGKSVSFHQLHQGSPVSVVAIALDERTLELEARQVQVEATVTPISPAARPALARATTSKPQKPRAAVRHISLYPETTKVASGNTSQRFARRPVHIAHASEIMFHKSFRTAWAEPAPALLAHREAIRHTIHLSMRPAAHPASHHSHPAAWNDSDDSDNPPPLSDAEIDRRLGLPPDDSLRRH